MPFNGATVADEQLPFWDAWDLKGDQKDPEVRAYGMPTSRKNVFWGCGERLSAATETISPAVSARQTVPGDSPIHLIAVQNPKHPNKSVAVSVTESSNIYHRGGALEGGRRWCVACSYPYASVISLPSLHARPKNVIPAGSALPRVYPIGTVIAGKPVVGEKS